MDNNNKKMKSRSDYIRMTTTSRNESRINELFKPEESSCSELSESDDTNNNKSGQYSQMGLSLSLSPSHCAFNQSKAQIAKKRTEFFSAGTDTPQILQSAVVSTECSAASITPETNHKITEVVETPRPMDEYLLSPLTNFHYLTDNLLHKDSLGTCISRADALLFSMFAFRDTFDSICNFELNSKCVSNHPGHIEELYLDLKRLFRTRIVNRCRKFEVAGGLQKLRDFYLNGVNPIFSSKNRSDTDLQFLAKILQNVLNAKCFIHIDNDFGRSIASSYWHIIKVDAICSNEADRTFTTQYLFERSMLTCKLTRLPDPALIILLEHENATHRIVPSLNLDLAHVQSENERECCFCGEVSKIECRDCFGLFNYTSHMQSTSFCDRCCRKIHENPIRKQHRIDFIRIKNSTSLKKAGVKLTAILCKSDSEFSGAHLLIKCDANDPTSWILFTVECKTGEFKVDRLPEVENLMTQIEDDPSFVVGKHVECNNPQKDFFQYIFMNMFACIYC